MNLTVVSTRLNFAAHRVALKCMWIILKKMLGEFRSMHRH